MAKLADDTVIDAALNAVKNATSPVLHVCSGTPATRANVLTNTLANQALSAPTGPADDTSGRKLDFVEQADIATTAAGDATHVSIIDGTNLLLQTTTATTTLANPGTVTVQTFKWNIQDPT